jgi:hypothetical protein
VDLRRLLAAASVVALVRAAYGSSAPVLLCGEIPDGGCPIGRGGSCDDVACAALYDCVDGAWTEVERCSGGGVTTGGGGPSGAGGEGGGACAPAVIDRTGEADGCTPDLLDPDCPAAAAEVCDPCGTGCADFFLCTADGWIDVAACDEDGVLTVLR